MKVIRIWSPVSLPNEVGRGMVPPFWQSDLPLSDLLGRVPLAESRLAHGWERGTHEQSSGRIRASRGPVARSASPSANPVGRAYERNPCILHGSLHAP